VHTPEAKSVPAAVTPEALAIVVKAIAMYPNPVTRTALSFCAMTTMRPANVAEARWDHIDLKAATWTIPAAEMKSKKSHTVPLPKQALELLQQAESWRRHGGWVFPAQAQQDTPHLHRDTLSKALRELGLRGEHVPHGFRSSFRTIAREEWKIDIDVLEAQIAHAKQGQVNKAYDRTRFLKERVEVMQLWADLLEQLMHQKAEL
jgi:integrase